VSTRQHPPAPAPGGPVSSSPDGRPASSADLDPGPMPPTPGHHEGGARSRRRLVLAAVAAVALLGGGAATLVAGLGANSTPSSPPAPQSRAPATYVDGPPVLPTDSPIAATTTSAANSATPTSSRASLPPPPPATGTLTQDSAVAAAKAVYRRYVAVDNQVGAGGYTSAAPYTQVAVSPELDSLRKATSTRKGAHRVGEVTVSSLQVQQVSLREDPGYYPQVVLLACLDLTKVSSTDKQGRPRSRKGGDAIKARAVLRRYRPGTPGVPASGGWYVADGQQDSAPSC